MFPPDSVMEFSKGVNVCEPMTPCASVAELSNGINVWEPITFPSSAVI